MTPAGRRPLATAPSAELCSIGRRLSSFQTNYKSVAAGVARDARSDYTSAGRGSDPGMSRRKRSDRPAQIIGSRHRLDRLSGIAVAGLPGSTVALDHATECRPRALGDGCARPARAGAGRRMHQREDDGDGAHRDRAAPADGHVGRCALPRRLQPARRARRSSSTPSTSPSSTRTRSSPASAARWPSRGLAREQQGQGPGDPRGGVRRLWHRPARYASSACRG